jgi:RNA polymerase sigma-70 factor (ECF subfamily)
MTTSISGGRSVHEPDVGYATAPLLRTLEASPVADAPTLAQVFRDHAPFAWRTLRHYGVPEADLEDATQEVFLVVQRKLPGFRGDSSLRTWLHSICRRVAGDWRKSRRRRREILTEAPPDSPEPAPQERLVHEHRTRTLLAGLLSDLDHDKREVFVLYEIEELPMAEVATMIGCPVQTAYYRLYAARRQVRDAWRALRGEGGGS